MKVKVVRIRGHVRGQIYEVVASGKTVSILFTFHAMERIARWRLTDQKVLRALLFPEEVLRGQGEGTYEDQILS